MKTTVAIVGLGSRGRVTYAPIAKQYPDLMEITALADINPACVEEAAKEYNVPKERCFTSAEELLAQPKLADAIFILNEKRSINRSSIPGKPFWLPFYMYFIFHSCPFSCPGRL